MWHVTLKKVSANASTAPVAAPTSLPAPHSVDMHSSVKNKVESKLKECNKKQPRDADAAARCTYRRDLEGNDIKSPEYKNAPVKKISSM